jgi:pyridinium-3,5-biscarboxylic acid mononucleotide sulfurtransferase
VDAHAKLEQLRSIIGAYDGAAVAYSGGCDSAFLADVAHEVLEHRAVAVTAVSESLAPAELDAARAVARERGWRHVEISTDELSRPAYRANAPDRCYHCKTELFSVLATLDLGVSEVLVGTNADDTGDFRPGQRAARERDVRAPMLDVGLTKDEIRSLSLERGLVTWNKPASACLASRIAYGVEVTASRLDRIAQAEAFLHGLGFAELRVRDHGELARIEVPLAAVERLASDGVRGKVAAFLRELGFTYITLDLEGFRSGSMNLLLPTISRRRAT